jgi:hypothetical protein
MRGQRTANWFAMLWAGSVALGLVYLPAILLPVLAPSRTTFEQTAAGGLTQYTERTVGVLDGASPAEFLSVLLPLLVAIVPLLVSRSERWRRTTSAIGAALVGLYVLLGIMTVGLLFVPSVVALARAADRGTDSESPAVT